MSFFRKLLSKIRTLLRPGREDSKFRRFAVAPVGWLSAAGLTFCIALGLYFTIKALTFPFKKLDDLPERTLVFDRKGESMGYVSGHGENRVAVKLENVSPNFTEALIAREDSRFYKHGGVDFRGVARAALRNLKDGDVQQGASTITMQLARNAWGLKQKTLARKMQEVALAQRLERRLSKDEILEHYVNRIYFGYGLYGIERASQGFFMKPASELTVSEGAMMAAVIRGPSLLNPFRDLKSAKVARNEVLARLVADEKLTQAEADAAKNEEVKLRPSSKRSATGSYVLQEIHGLLDDLLDPDEIAEGSLRIYTTIDQELQNTAQTKLNSHLTEIESRSGFPHPSKSKWKSGATNYVQGAVVSIDNQTGAILAMAGGRDFKQSSFNRALNAERQCGSTFKAFVYAAAFDEGLMPGTWVSDDAIRYDTGDKKFWSPKNSDGTFLGDQPAAVGLIRSRNTMSVRVGQIARLEQVQGLARALQMGEIPDSPVSYLGAFETTLMTLTSAYSTFPAQGKNNAPYLIDRIESAEGDVLFQSRIRSEQILRPSIAWLTSDVLGNVMQAGTGQTAEKLGYSAPSYGKTGTTNDYRDAWFLGFTDKVTTGVWVGMDKPATIMSRGYGSTLALPIWTEVMKTAETAGFKAEKIGPPSELRTVEVCRACGGLETRGSLAPYQMGLPGDLIPRFKCPGHGRSSGGLFDFFSKKTDAQRDQERLERYRESERRRSERRDDGEGGVGEALRGIGRFIFGPSQ